MSGYNGKASVLSVHAVLLLLGMSLLAVPGCSFQEPPARSQCGGRTNLLAVRRQFYRIQASSQVSDDSSSPVTANSADVSDFLQGAEILDLSLKDHRPLGCTVEESLGKRYGPVVFCSKVTPGGFAEKAGIQSGDVFLGVSGMFGNLEDVTKAGIDRVKSYVSACPDDETLVLRLARGTPVMDDHEEAVVDLCSNPGKSDGEVDECVTDFLRAGYYSDDDNNDNDVNGETDSTDSSGQDDDNNMLDNMFNMWAEDLPVASRPVEDVDATPETKDKPKPWSSRSSPSGTFVRDPRTGKMTNLDA